MKPTVGASLSQCGSNEKQSPARNVTSCLQSFAVARPASCLQLWVQQRTQLGPGSMCLPGLDLDQEAQGGVLAGTAEEEPQRSARP